MGDRPKNLKVVYHWPRKVTSGGGIGRYIGQMTSTLGDQVTLRNLSAPSSPDKPFGLAARLWFLFDLFFPFVRIKPAKFNIYWGVAHKLPIFKIKGVPYVVTIHDLVWKTCPETMPFTRHLTERFFFRIALRNADAILAVSKSTSDDIARNYPKFAQKVQVIPLAGFVASMDHAGAGAPASGQEYLLFVGTIEPRKNIENLLKAYAGLSEEMKTQYHLILVGKEGWGGIDLEKLIAEAGLQEFVEWKSAVTDAELIGLYKHAYGLVMPSLYEGFGLPILEAQHFGVPVITSNISSMPEVAGDGALLVDPSSTKDINDKLNQLMTNPELHHTLSAKAKNNAAQFSWARTVEQTCKVFKNVVSVAKGV